MIQIILVMALAVLATFIAKLVFEIRLSLWRLKSKTEGESGQSE